MPTLTEKLQLSQELGLKNIAEIASSQIQQKKVADLLGTELLREVKLSDLHKIFGTDKINKKLLKNHRIIAACLGIVGVVSSAAAIWGFMHIHTATSAPGIAVISTIAAAVFLVGPLAMFCSHPDYIEFYYTKIDHYSDDIPYGALLKLKEVTGKVTFDNIYVIRPAKARLSDPALVGEIRNKKYLIYAWDMDKDIENLAL